MEIGLCIRAYLDDPTRSIYEQVEEATEICRRARSLGFAAIYAPQHFVPHPTVWLQPMQILVRYGRYSPMEAIVANTKDNAFSVGLEDQLGVVAPDKLADIILLNADPVENIQVLQGGKHLVAVIKDGKMVDLNGHKEGEEELLKFQTALT